MDTGLYQHFFEFSSDGMVITDAENRIIHINQAFTQITGYSIDELYLQNPRLLASGRHDAVFFSCLWEQLLRQGNWLGAIWNKHKNGTIYPIWQSINILKDQDGEITYFISVFSNISALKTTENELWKLAHYDVLTGLLNRRALELRLAEEISAAKRSGRAGVLLFFDLDDFKKINDSHGHKVGDRLLVALAERLNTHIRHEDVFARLSGDEFVVLLTDLPAELATAAKAAAGLIKNMLQTFSEAFLLDGHAIHVSASFGVTFFHPFAETPDEALKQADTAMYLSKKQGKNTYTFYHPAMQEAANHRLYFEVELRNAIRNKQIYLAYQPQFDQDQQLLGYEALARWRHPDKGVILPSAFIALAEEIGIIVEIGEEIMSIACRQLAQWQLAGVDIPMLSINVSPSQFNHHNFVDMTLAILSSTLVDPAKITLEVTEGLIINNVDRVINKMQLLKQWGVRFAIDDFGTGYSSLAYLSKMPIDQLKIDRSFVQDIVSSNSDAVIVNTILSMASHLELEIIAEGVENQAQIDHLLKSGCKGFQGYWFSKPLTPEEIC
jgi:diguanylate cyclase (GGDEF)-like protein/PAS domain S-box-containing protein